jgi:hypothetical protein
LKKLVIFPVLLIIVQASAQSGWQQSLHYDIDVKFRPGDKSLDADMKLNYVNHSPDTLHFIWFHLWPNAYRNDMTLYSDQLIENGDTRFYFSSKNQKGYINRLDFRVNGTLAVLEDHPEYIDVVKLLLPTPLVPADSITIAVSFHLRFPFNFNGNGYSSHHFEIRNWYPEPAVYDLKGWHPIPFLVQGGAYHEAADYFVKIESPATYSIASGSVADTLSQNDSTIVTGYSLENANSFAWTADTRFKVEVYLLETGSAIPIRLQYFYLPSNSIDFNSISSSVKTDIHQISGWLGAYPHKSISIVTAAPMENQNFSGMVCIGANPSKEGWQNSLRKELLGQWFQTGLLSDQRNLPWFSKGFIYFYNQRLIQNLSPNSSKHLSSSKDNLWLRVAEHEKTTQPIETSAPEFSVANDTLIASSKAALWLKQLQDSLGMTRFDENIRDYFSVWKFGHPYPSNFNTIIKTGSEKDLQPMFEKLKGNQSLFPDDPNQTLKTTFIFSAKNSERYNYIGLAPVPGYNKYDGFMLGALIHNINLPENKFEFLLTPLYAFASGRLEGLGRLSYTWHPSNQFSRIIVGINGSRFATNKETDSTGKLMFENFFKLVPYIRVDFKPSSPRSTVSHWMDFKIYFISEYTYGQFNVSSTDSLIHPNSVTQNFRYVNQLSYNIQNDRTLYPYSLRAEFQQSELFYRINLKANYFFNYPDGGGMQVRFFGAKFGVWNENNGASVTRYEPKLLGVNGDEDYLYEDYFIGRSASYAVENTSVPNAGLAAQQIMNRDGGLKLRIDAYDYVQGKSANWVSSLNFNTTLPAKLFPFPLPIRIFFDFGTYAEAWENNPPTSHFLYTGGIQLSLFKNILNIYAPLIYSSDFNDALGSTNFGRKITFSIDIQNINYKKLIRKAADR